MEEAIKKAIEGGYPTNGWVTNLMAGTLKGSDRFHIGHIEASITLDPLFWQCLGSALNWTTVYSKGSTAKNAHWKEQMHRFIDALIEGKTPTEFFTSLLSK